MAVSEMREWQMLMVAFMNDRFKIVIITASAFDQDGIRYAQLGANQFITKPFRGEQIINCLDELLDVEFEYEQEEFTKQESSSAAELDYSKISLPEDLLLQIKKDCEQLRQINRHLSLLFDSQYNHQKYHQS